MMTTRWGELGREALLAGRRLRRSPGLSLAAVAMLALAIGADTAVFSVVEAVLLRPLPYRDPGRLVALWEDHSPREGSPRTMVAAETFEDYRRQSRTLRRLSAVLSHELDLIGAGEPEVLYGSEVSADFFPLLGAAPLFGRVLTAADARPGAAPAVVLSHELWRRHRRTPAGTRAPAGRRSPASRPARRSASCRVPAGRRHRKRGHGGSAGSLGGAAAATARHAGRASAGEAAPRTTAA